MVTSNHWLVKDGRLCYFLASRSESLAKNFAPTKPYLQISFLQSVFFGKIWQNCFACKGEKTCLNFVHFGKILLVRLIPRNHFPKPGSSICKKKIREINFAKKLDSAQTCCSAELWNILIKF